jgi:chemotaxis signal transduction protein
MLGLLVDKISGVLKTPLSLIQPVAEPVLNFGVEFIEGLAILESRLIILFRLEKILAFEETKALPEWEGVSHGEEKFLDH